MTHYPKRLIEVDLPIRRISAHARREKSIRHGHISTLHIWWARRPLAACRAVICAALWPDPADELCPQPFRDAVAKLLPAFAEQVRRSDRLGNLCSTESRQRWMRTTEGSWRADHAASWFDMREALLDFIADFANWDASTVPAYLETARGLTQASHEALGGEPGTRPLVIDPFAGGGAIPLEALRVGADAFASDLNPVAVLLNKVVLEYIPKYGNAEFRMMNAEGEEVVFHGLAEAVRYWGQWIKEQAERELAEFYPKDPDGATPIAYLWARTIRCEGPGCGAEVPLMRSMDITRDGRKWSYDLVSEKDGQIRLAVQEGKSSNSRPTVAGGRVTCPVCDYTTSESSVKAQLMQKRGGGGDARLLSVYVEKGKERYFRVPAQHDLEAVARAKLALEPSEIPTDKINPVRPYSNTRGLSAVTRIGIETFGDLYTARQMVAIQAFQRLVLGVAARGVQSDGDRAVLTILSFAASRLVFQNCVLSRWNVARSTIEGAFGKQALQIVWDFAEANPISDGPANWDGAVDWIHKVVEALGAIENVGTAILAPAQQQLLPSGMAQALVTDPPYFAAIPYADLSNVFYVWERNVMRVLHPDLYAPGLVKQEDEITVTKANLGRHGREKTPEFYRHEMATALLSARHAVTHYGIGVVVFAESRTESWEAILGAVIDGGWQVTGSWPIDTEMASRTQAADAASLMSSIHIVCRPRSDRNIGDWREVLQELPKRVHFWLPHLAREGIVGADAIFACLGPALEIFSRYSRVEKASGEVMTLSTYLEYVWAAVSKEALDMVFQGADTSGFEEDARLTAMWLWTLGGDGDGNGAQKSNFSEKLDFSTPAAAKVVASTGYTLEFDAARKIAQGLGAHLEQLGHLVEIKGSNARLLPAVERTRYLFGVESAKQPARRGKREAQLSLFEAMGKEEAEAAGWTMDDDLAISPGRTVLDRVHQSMLLFAAGRSNALKRYLVDEGIGKDERFWSLAQALSALYPSHTDEKRWVDGVLARKKGLGF